MHNRVGTNNLTNNAVRYGVYNAAGVLLRYEWLKLEDEPLELGTPLVAENLLADTTVPHIWTAGDAPNDPSVDQALARMTESQYQIGTILVTVRHLEAPWHLCDGSTYSQTTYPELYALLGRTVLPTISFSADTDVYIRMANA